MFNSITGTVTGKAPKQLFLENNGIEWDICMPDSNLDVLPPVGKEAKVFTWLQHTDSLMSLYGFATNGDRLLFLDLLKVDGVGPKGAVKIMSNVSLSRLSEVLERGDLEMLEKIPGVGKKTAGKIMLTLKGKLAFSSDSKTFRVPSSSPYEDVISSLVSMGYDKNLVQAKVFELSERFSGDSGFTGKSKKDKEDYLFRIAIVELS